MHYFLYLLNMAFSSGQSALGKRYAISGGKSEIFNLNKIFSGLTVFGVIGIIGGLSFHWQTVLFGIGCGLVLSAANHTGFKALSSGPMALTSTVVSFSFIVPFIFGITVWHESISLYGIIGICLLCISVALLNMRKQTGISVKWAVYTFATLLLNGIYSIIQKYHQLYFPNRYRIEFLITVLLIALLSTLIFTRQRSVPLNIEISSDGILAGIMNGLSNYIVLYLSATENASVLFPAVSIAQIITTCFIGRFAFSEKLRCMQIFGIVLGIISIALLNI